MNSQTITITLTEEEWKEIYMEADAHLNYSGGESDAVEKLGDILFIKEERG